MCAVLCISSPYILLHEFSEQDDLVSVVACSVGDMILFSPSWTTRKSTFTQNKTRFDRLDFTCYVEGWRGSHSWKRNQAVC